MTKTMHDFWQTCVAQLEQELPKQQISIWVRPLVPLAFDEAQAVLRVSAPNVTKQKWAQHNFQTRIESLASDWYGRAVQVVFELAAKPGGNARMAPAHHGTPVLTPPDAQTQAPALGPSMTEPAIQHVGTNSSGLIADYRFDNFVTGKANQLAHMIALQVTENPGASTHNPLFLYGDSGLGKTHLINAIGHALLANHPQAKVRYIHANDYVSDLVAASQGQGRTMDAFKQYYQSLDLLLIDDIQFFDGNKVRTREEFFYVFEAMVVRRNKQVVITSDKYPKELPIGSRLASRFASGLPIAIEPPELEMRVAILLNKAQSRGIVMPEPVAFFIAKHVRSNVRELEGALNTVSAYANNFLTVRGGRRAPLTMEICKEALKPVISLSSGQVTVENIQKTVAEYFKIKVADMFTQRKAVNVVRPRQVAMFLARELTNKSLPEIAGSFAKKDHTTVINAIKRITELRAKAPDLNHAIHVLEQTLRG